MSVPAITTPCHGATLLILTRSDGYGHLATDVPDEIMCTADGCFNSWDAAGESAPWNKMPNREDNPNA